MRQLTCLFVLLPFAACVDSAEPTEPNRDFSCLVSATSTAVAEPSIAASGRVLDEIGGAAIAHASIELRAVDTDANLGWAWAPAGSYEAAIDTSGRTVRAYRKAMADGYLDAYSYDPSPMTDAEQLQPMLTPDGAVQLYARAGLAYDATRGTLLVVVTDCDGRRVRGATVSVESSAGVMYLGDDTKFDHDLTSTSGNSGVLVFGVQPGPVDVVIEVDDVTYRPWPVASYANAFTTSWRRP